MKLAAGSLRNLITVILIIIDRIFSCLLLYYSNLVLILHRYGQDARFQEAIIRAGPRVPRLILGQEELLHIFVGAAVSDHSV